MEYHSLGKTGLHVSLLGFGCGGVGGIMVGNDYPHIIHIVERALQAGINYFDTAQLYGEGRSEENLGRVFHDLKPDVIVGTKTRPIGLEMEHIERAIIQSAEASLQRLQMEKLDLFQLHNPIHLQRNQEKGWVGIDDLDQVQNAFLKLQSAGKILYWGINGIGETQGIHQWIEKTQASTIQVCFNLINPSANCPIPADYPFQDYMQSAKRAKEHDLGVIAFRILAGGALSANYERHPTAAKYVDPIASSGDYNADVDLARHFDFLVSDGWARSLPEAAIRFSISQPGISTIPIGFSSLEQLEEAIKAVETGPLPETALYRLPDIWHSIAELSKND